MCDFCGGSDTVRLGRFVVCRTCVRGLIRGERPLTMPRSAFRRMRETLHSVKCASGIRLSFGREHRISGRWPA